MKKAQGATEYLIILAIVIIIALIVVGVMGDFTSLGKSTKPRAKTLYWDSAEIGILSHAIQEDNNNDNIHIEIRNNMQFPIFISDIEINSVELDFTDFMLTEGARKTITDDSIGDVCDEGDTYSFSVAINYTDNSTGFSYGFDGDGNKIEGICAQEE